MLRVLRSWINILHGRLSRWMEVCRMWPLTPLIHCIKSHLILITTKNIGVHDKIFFDILPTQNYFQDFYQNIWLTGLELKTLPALLCFEGWRIATENIKQELATVHSSVPSKLKTNQQKHKTSVGGPDISW